MPSRNGQATGWIVGTSQAILHRGTTFAWAYSRDERALRFDQDPDRRELVSTSCGSMLRVVIDSSVNGCTLEPMSVHILYVIWCHRQDAQAESLQPRQEAACIDLLQPDLAHAGGITEVRKIAAMAE